MGFKPETLSMESRLIDNVVGGYCVEHEEFAGEMYLKKPLSSCLDRSLGHRLACCKEILQGRAIAVHYKRDEVIPRKRKGIFR